MCVICNPSDKSSHQEHSREGIYLGESSRSLYEHSKENLRDAESFDPGSHIVKHWMNEHPNMKDCLEFSFSILSRFRDSLSRQVAEAINIQYTKDQLLNSKTEYMANCLTRICIKENRFEEEKREKDRMKSRKRQSANISFQEQAHETKED